MRFIITLPSREARMRYKTLRPYLKIEGVMRLFKNRVR
jgi:hypothetical protein